MGSHENETAPAGPAERFGVGLRFGRGWCQLLLKDAQSEVSLGATTMHDSFSDLISATSRLLTTSRCQSVLWGGEGRGWFVDMSADFTGGLGIAVHEMRDHEWLSPSKKWRPVRSNLVFEGYGNLGAFTVDLMQTSRRAQTELADKTGYMPEWGWYFPNRRIEELGELSERYGYRPSV